MDRQKWLSLQGNPQDIHVEMQRLGLTDGLPVVPPTPELVNAMLAFTDYEPEESIGQVPPRWGEATLYLIAANAVMAGCLPEHIPVLVAAIQAVLQPAFNLSTLQVTTYPFAPLLLINGPVSEQLAINGGGNAFGPGQLANAVIGRALNLILRNIGGARPGETSFSTQGNPGRYTYCVAENAEASPWPPYHVDLGYSPEASTVTVIGAEAPHNVMDSEHDDPVGILTVVADELSALGKNIWACSFLGRHDVWVALAPEHAASIAAAGWTKEDAQYFLYHRSMRPADEIARGGYYASRDWAPWQRGLEQCGLALPVARRPQDIRVVVLGGTGKHSSVIATYGVTQSCTVAIRHKDGALITDFRESRRVRPTE